MGLGISSQEIQTVNAITIGCAGRNRIGRIVTNVNIPNRLQTDRPVLSSNAQNSEIWQGRPPESAISLGA